MTGLSKSTRACWTNLAHDLYEAGETTSLYEELPFAERLIAIYQESGKVHAQYFDFSLPQGNVKPDTPFWAGPAVFGMLTNASLLDSVESILGGEIYSNPVQHVRLKPPEHLTPINQETGRVMLGKTVVHQDHGVVRTEADETQMLTVWFPLMDVNVENGCLCVWPGSHKRGLIDHCPTNLGLAVPGKLLEGKARAMIMNKGDALLMHKQTLHASYSNNSDSIRWSFDIRYNPTGQPTGRPAFPGFVARSRKYPDTVLTRTGGVGEAVARYARSYGQGRRHYELQPLDRRQSRLRVTAEGRRQWSVVSGQWLVVSGQWLVVSGCGVGQMIVEARRAETLLASFGVGDWLWVGRQLNSGFREVLE